MSIVGNGSVLALLDRVSGIRVNGKIGKFNRKVAREVHDGRYVAKNLVESFLKKPFVGILLHLEEVGHIARSLYLGKAFSYVGAEFTGSKHHK